LADLLGWKDELLKLVDTEHKKIDEATAKVDESQNTGDCGFVAFLVCLP